jgi:hypothetical protein
MKNLCLPQSDVERQFRILQKRVKKVKVKDSRNRPGVAQRVPGVLGSEIS